MGPGSVPHPTLNVKQGLVEPDEGKLKVQASSVWGVKDIALVFLYVSLPPSLAIKGKLQSLIKT